MQPPTDAASNRSSLKLMQPQNDPVKNLNIHPCSHKLIAEWNVLKWNGMLYDVMECHEMEWIVMGWKEMFAFVAQES
ncbi:hypothetical protein BgiBS90_014065 [Biomphalaria glabrata]|nr:hypothetical protein BgiBS90_014065 [Biomphalaria glabrata]